VDAILAAAIFVEKVCPDAPVFVCGLEGDGDGTVMASPSDPPD
jgi:hypothetical protein